jgi:hypothetical protein
LLPLLLLLLLLLLIIIIVVVRTINFKGPITHNSAIGECLGGRAPLRERREKRDDNGGKNRRASERVIRLSAIIEKIVGARSPDYHPRQRNLDVHPDTGARAISLGRGVASSARHFLGPVARAQPPGVKQGLPGSIVKPCFRW